MQLKISVEKREYRNQHQTDHKTIKSRQRGNVVDSFIFGIPYDIGSHIAETDKDNDKGSSLKKLNLSKDIQTKE
jgi:hypothetical protein